MIFYILWIEKIHNLKIESYDLFGRLSEDLSPGPSISDNAEKTVPERLGGESGDTEVFATKDQAVRTSKNYCLIREKQTSQVKGCSAFLCMSRCKNLGSLKSFL